MTKRLRYFNGQFLKQEDFRDEQTYHRDMRKRHNKGIHTLGVVDGLSVSFKPGVDNKLVIAMGWAIDKEGREIILDDYIEMDLPSSQALPCYVTCKFDERTTDPQPEGDTGFTGDRRIEEITVIEIVDQSTTDALVLAEIKLDNGKRVVTDKRQFSGIKLPGDLSIDGNMVVKGQTTVVQTEKIQGNVTLGDEDGDTVTVKGVMLTGHSSGKLKIGDSSRVTSVDVTGEITVTGNVDGRDIASDGTKLDSHLLTLHATTAAQVGALASSGGTLSGNLQVNGNVGIGSFTTTAPAYRLEVNLGANTGTADRVRFGNAVCCNGAGADSVYAVFSHESKASNTSYALRQGPDGDVQINAPTDQPISICQNGITPCLLVSEKGNVIIHGTGDQTGAGTAKFQVVGSTYLGGDLRIAKGNVGIGSFTAAPTYRLEVNLDANTATTERVRFGNAVCCNGAGGDSVYAVFSHESKASNTSYALRQGPDGDVQINAPTDQPISICQNGITPRLLVSEKGNVIIRGTGDLLNAGPAIFQVEGATYIHGNLKIDGNLEITGTATKPGGGPWTPTTSDARVKEDVRDLEAGLAQLRQVRPVRFRFNGRAGTVAGQADVGIIAQEIEKIFPEMIRKIPGGFDNDPTQEDLRVYDGSALTYVLVNAVKELAGKVEHLEKALADALKQRGGGRNPA